MEAAAIGSVAGAAGETTGKRFQDLGNEDFFALLIAQRRPRSSDCRLEPRLHSHALSARPM